VRYLIVQCLELIPTFSDQPSLPCLSRLHLAFAGMSFAEEGNRQELAHRSGLGSRRERRHAASRDRYADDWCAFATRTHRLCLPFALSPSPCIACHSDGEPARTCGRCGPGDGTAAVAGASSWYMRSICTGIRLAAAVRRLRHAMSRDLVSGAHMRERARGGPEAAGAQFCDPDRNISRL
jgi:hypothetical protein